MLCTDRKDLTFLATVFLFWEGFYKRKVFTWSNFPDHLARHTYTLYPCVENMKVIAYIIITLCWPPYVCQLQSENWADTSILRNENIFLLRSPGKWIKLTAIDFSYASYQDEFDLTWCEAGQQIISSWHKFCWLVAGQLFGSHVCILSTYSVFK